MAAVVVVGAGIVGAAVAWELAARGVEVTVLDVEASPGRGVTGASFGWIGGSGGHWPGGARELREFVLADYRRLAGEVAGVDVRWCGSLAWDEASGLDGALGEGRFLVGRGEIAAMEPALREPPERAVHTPSDAGVDPTAVAEALVAAASARGAEVRTGVRVTGLETANGRVVGVRSSAGAHRAARVVLAAGTEVVRLCRPLGVALPVVGSPARGVRMAAPAGLVRTVVAAPGCEVREAGDGTLRLTLPPGRDAREALRGLFRGAGEAVVLDDRVGNRPLPANGPIVGPVTPDRALWVAVLHPGVTLAPTVARLLAEELTGDRPVAELARCRPALPRTGPA
ncbi:FAD-dependent oxidoreductase [Streptomyces sp. 3MP-14]|uniref:FAD-dependent oxidoreductase n=1 Tax=Streptomyces mimosae TaxID=2586635 RepID=A0A5N6AL69_9ACTN|nr:MULTISPECIES: FAD-binding oxidoreductase [Streptomyces]KAB8168630.1 FAD-dependent oxidoreductase [Streptomyces mimosae]KAB8178090.1 FAD-dependent oxidoreductase [Streptomyces sp. 3MP-14]